MRISINNFKSIGSLTNYEIKPLTILSGTNSSGKSSFIQLLLLLKETMKLDSTNFPLVLNGRLFRVTNYLDILNCKASDNKLKIELRFNKKELANYSHYNEISIYNVFDNYDVSIGFEFDFKDNRVSVSEFVLKFIVSDRDKSEHYLRTSANSNGYNIETNVAVFSNKDLYERQGDYKIKSIIYSAFIPSTYEIEYFDGNGATIKEILKLDGIRAILKDYFESLNYIGPSREKPREEYRNTGNYLTVGAEGENVAEVLEKLSSETIKYIIIEEESDSPKFVERQGTFLEAVKYWLCQRFNLCSDIYSKKTADSYVIYVKSLNGVESTIRHVGFGISQILPIIVEGIRLSSGETLILEQPEIHLHPKVQSQLFDFLISIVQQGKKVIVETHSDHLITRLRRRIAEDSCNTLHEKISLTFIESSASDLIFRNIGIDDFGGLDYFPIDFIEKADVELKAILKAQMRKRIFLKEQ